MRVRRHLSCMEWRRARLASVSGFMAITMMAAFGIVIFALHALAAQNGQVPYYLSHFMLLDHAWLWLVGLGIFAAGAVALAISLTIAMPPGGWSRVSLGAIWAVGPLTIIVAAFPAAAPGADTDWIGRTHEVAAIGMFIALGIAMVGLFPALRWGWTGIAWTSLLLGLTFFALTPWMIRGFILGTPDVMYSERIVVAIHGIWLFTIGVWARSETAPFARRRPVTIPRGSGTASPN